MVGQRGTGGHSRIGSRRVGSLLSLGRVLAMQNRPETWPVHGLGKIEIIERKRIAFPKSDDENSLAMLRYPSAGVNDLPMDVVAEFFG